MLFDTHDRQFNYVRLSITDVCNFKCNYCLPDGYQHQAKKQFLTLPEITNLTHALRDVGVTKVRITGGEPSLRKDLPQIIETVKRVCGIDTVAMTTNGYRLNEQVADWHAAGLDQLNISIDSLHPGQFNLITGSTKLQAILDGIDKAITLGFSEIKVNVVLLKKFNYAEFTHFLAWIKDKPIVLRFIELMQTGDNEAFFNEQHVRASLLQAQVEASGWVRKIRSSDAGPAIEYQHPEYAGQIGFITPYGDEFCTTCNRMRISATGQLHTCLFSEEGLDGRYLMQSTDQQPLLEQWLISQAYNKKATHGLHEHMTGAMTHLAMLGG